MLSPDRQQSFHRHFAGVLFDPAKLAAGAGQPLLEHAEIPTRQTVVINVLRHPFHAEAAIDLPARGAGLRYLDHRVAELKDVADAHVRFVPAGNGKVFTERAGNEIIDDVRKCVGQRGIIPCRILVQGLFGPAMYAKVGLFVSSQPVHANPGGLVQRCFEYPAGSIVRRQGADASRKERHGARLRFK